MSVIISQWRIQEFPEGAPTPDVAAPSYYFANFFYQKLHENERTWTEKKGTPMRSYCDREFSHFVFKFNAENLQAKYIRKPV